MYLLSGYIFRTTLMSIFIVLVVIGSLDSISRFLEELGSIENQYTFKEVLIYVALLIPASIYKYMPFASLVGALVGLGSLASTSELVVMRAAGVSTLHIIWMVLKPVLLLIAIMLAFAEYMIPITDQYAEDRKAALLQQPNKALNSASGLWSRDHNTYMHFNRIQTNGTLLGITRYHYDDSGKLHKASFSEKALYVNEQWQEEQVSETIFDEDTTTVTDYISRTWETNLSPDLLAVLVQQTDNLAISKLLAYANYLKEQNLDNTKYLLAYWSKILQPLVIISLVLIAISFVFGPLREVNMGYRVFIGVVVGIVFQLSQKLVGPVSLLYGVPPLLAVLLPILLCLFFGWVLIMRTR